MAREIDAEYPGTYDKVLRLMELCQTVYDSVNVLSVHPMSKPAMLAKHAAFVKTCGYSAKQVLDTFGLPREVFDILSAYWIYVGAPMDDLPFTIYAVLMLPKNTIGRTALTRLNIYKGAEHKNAAQKPEAWTLD